MTVFPLFLCQKSKLLPSLFAQSLFFKDRRDRFALVALFTKEQFWANCSQSLFFKDRREQKSEERKIERATYSILVIWINWVKIRIMYKKFSVKINAMAKFRKKTDLITNLKNCEKEFVNYYFSINRYFLYIFCLLSQICVFCWSSFYVQYFILMNVSF